MDKQFYFLLLYILAFLVILACSEMVYRKFNVNPEYTRKISHIIVTLTSLSFVYAFQSHWYVFGLAVFSFLLLFIGKLLNAFKSIEDVHRPTFGSILLPAGIYLSFAIAEFQKNNLVFILPILILAISDALAGIIGIRFQKSGTKIILLGIKFDKSMAGTFTFLFSALIISFSAFLAYGFDIGKVIILTIAVSLTTTITELVSPYGSDNLTISVAASTLLIYML